MTAFVVFAAFAPLLSPSTAPNLTPLLTDASVAYTQAKAFSATDAWAKTRGAIAARYYAKDTQKAKMDGLLNKYEAPAKAAKTADEFRDVVNRMIAEFGDSHFEFMTKADQGYYMMRNLLNPEAEAMPHIGVWFKKVNGQWIAQMVLNDMPGARAGIQKGDVFKSINGKPFSPVQSLADWVDKTAKITVSRNGQEMAKDVDVESMRPADMFLRASQRSVKTIDYNGKKYGYMHMWALLPRQDFKDALAAGVSRNMNTDGFILDLRDGFGGRPEGFADLFYAPGIKVEYGAGNINMTSKMGYDKPLIVLINEGSRSAKEVLSHVLKSSKRATLIGKTTAGHVLGTSPMLIDDWAVLEIPMVNVIVEGVTLEGVGVSPHIKVDPEYDPAGTDLVVKRALEQLAGSAS
ncbi:MAG: hypothetical protein KF784_11725 [Fimbriimonadaceae bacterium]|nr:hypothetical protein [Fimbriimonadaceae bacterium]